MLVIPTVSEELFLSLILANNTLLRLFVNNFTPSSSTTLSNITECTSTGYSPITLANSSWTIGIVGGYGQASYAQQTFNLTSSTISYGYYITTTGGALMWVEAFSNGPYTISSSGSIAITPTINLHQ